MSKLIWTQPDGHQMTYDFDPEDLLWAEVDAIQRVTGAKGLVEIGEMLESANARAIPAILWVMRKRDEPALTFEQAREGLRIKDVSLEEDPAEGKEEPSAIGEATQTTIGTPTESSDPSQTLPIGSDSTPGTSSD